MNYIYHQFIQGNYLMASLCGRLTCILFFVCISVAGCKNLSSQPEDSSINHYSESAKTNDIKDSAPKNPPKLKYVAVKPVDEKMSRYGNPSSYVVDGQKYDVLVKANGYSATGLASWYGTKFHKKRTSSGEKYDMYALTAAHRTLPLPTYVKVKNLENGNEAIVKVNDRGPFHSGRILDLSYAAANKLGILAKGTAMVEVTAISKSQSIANYYLQAGAFSSNQLALHLKKEVEKYAPNSKVFITEDSKRFLVRVGPFVDRAVSERVKQTLQSKGISAFAMIM